MAAGSVVAVVLRHAGSSGPTGRDFLVDTGFGASAVSGSPRNSVIVIGGYEVRPAGIETVETLFSLGLKFPSVAVKVKSLAKISFLAKFSVDPFCLCSTFCAESWGGVGGGGQKIYDYWHQNRWTRGGFKTSYMIRL